MQIILTVDDVISAPRPVRDWLLRLQGELPQIHTSAEPAKPPMSVESIESIESIERSAEPVNPTASSEDVLSKAVALIEAKGEDALKAVLSKFGVARVKECPAEKRADLLAEIAIQL